MLLTQVAVSACPARGATGTAAAAAVGTLTAAARSGRWPIGTAAAAEAADLLFHLCRPPGHIFHACSASNDFNGFNQTLVPDATASGYSERFANSAAPLLGFESRCTAVSSIFTLLALMLLLLLLLLLRLLLLVRLLLVWLLLLLLLLSLLRRLLLVLLLLLVRLLLLRLLVRLLLLLVLLLRLLLG